MKNILLFSFLLITGVSRAQSEFEAIKTALPSIKDSLHYVDALNRIGMLFYEANVDSTFHYARKARAIAKRLSYAKGEADALNNLGVFFDLKGNLQLAIHYYNEGHTAYRALKDSANCVQAIMNIAMVYKELGKDQRAIHYYRTALEEGKKLRKDSIMSLAIYNFILQFPDRFSADSLHFYINKAQNIAKRYKDQRTLIAIDQLIANDLIVHGKKEEGIAMLERTINLATEKKLYYTSMDMLLGIGDHLIETAPTAAISYYQRGLAIAKRNSYLIYSQMFSRKLYDYYLKISDQQKVVVYANELIKLYDQQQELNLSSSIDYLDYALKEEQLKSVIARSADQRRFLYLSIAAFLLALSIIVITRRHLKRIHRLNETVTKQNRQLKSVLESLEQSQSDNAKMMKIVAHDLRGPLGSIHALALMMLEDEDRSESDREILELVKTSGKDSLVLVDNLLKTQSKVSELKKELTDMPELLRYCVSLMSSNANAKNQELKLTLVPVRVLVSREKLWRVVSNLIGNAIKFSPKGTEINIKLIQLKETVLISVSDQGIGIPSEIRNTIFDLFTDAKRVGTDGEESFGLGLAISKQIVEAHQGKIWFEQNAEKGTTFFVELPITS